MKNQFYIVLLLAAFAFGACSSGRQIAFSDEHWHFSYASGHIVNQDSTIQISFGDHFLDPSATLISCPDSLSVYPGAESYVFRILKTCGLDNSRVWLYSPVENTMWVELPDGFVDVKPQAVSFNLLENRPVTSWVWDDDVSDGKRKPTEIYSNTFVNKSLGTLIVVDKLNYGDRPMACLHIFQSANKLSDSLHFKPWHWANKGNLLNHSYADILANWIDSRREVIFKNYRLGQQIDYRKKINPIREELKEIIRLDQEPRNEIVKAWQEHPEDTIMHQRIAGQILHNDSVNLVRVCQILDNYPLDFGEENEVLWAVIQHSSVELQQKYLPLFIEAADQHKLKGEFVAVMQDRIACLSGKPQIYGSQGNNDENGVFVPAPIVDPANVDMRRAAMGMCPLHEYIQMMSWQ